MKHKDTASAIGEQMNFPRGPIYFIAILAAIGTLYYAKGLLVPVVLALVIALTLNPIVQKARKYKIPAPISAATIVLIFGLSVGSAVAVLTEPVEELVAELPSIGKRIEQMVDRISLPLSSVSDASKQMDAISKKISNEEAQEVVVKQPDFLTRAADHVIGIIATSLFTLTLTYFLLVSRTKFYMKVVQSLPRLEDRKNAMRIANDVEHDISKYLLNVTVINAGLGACVAIVFWYLEMPSPVLWGVMAALLNFLPFVGALVGVLVASGVALVTFASPVDVLPVFLSYLALTTIEAQFVTPSILGRTLSINPVVILLSIALWGFLWGVVGVFLAVPILIIGKAISDRVTRLFWLSALLSADEKQVAE